MLEPHHIAIILTAVIAFAALSRKIEASIVTMPMFFTGFGWLIGQGGAELVSMSSEHQTVHLIAEITLILVLFSDASRVKIRDLARHVTLPARMLLVGMPLTIGAGTGVAYLVSPEAGWFVALLVAAILTPTDAALAQAVVSGDKAPARLRQCVNVESGLNDGLALPVVMVAAIAAVHMAGLSVEGAPKNLPLFALKQVTLGPVAGIVIGFAAARLLDLVIIKDLATKVYQGIYFLCTAFLCFVGAELIGGNGLIAAFVGGLTFGNTLKCSREFISEFMESEGQLLTMVTFLIFGAVMAPVGIEHASWKTLGLAIAFLTIVRLVPIWLSLTGTGLTPYEKFFLGWFGPRGLASILFALLILEKFPVPNAEEILACVVLTVMMSIVIHGVTAVPLSARFLKKSDA